MSCHVIHTETVIGWGWLLLSDTEIWYVCLYYKMLQELFLDKYTAKNVQNLAQTGKNIAF